MRRLVPLCGLILILAGCAKTAVSDVPSGFAKYSEGFRCVSPEGLRYSVRIVDNELEMSADFWAETARNQLERSGYRLVEGPVPLDSPMGRGLWLEWAVPWAGGAGVYVTAFYADRDRIVVVEAGGALESYEPRRESIMAAASTVRLAAAMPALKGLSALGSEPKDAR